MIMYRYKKLVVTLFCIPKKLPFFKTNKYFHSAHHHINNFLSIQSPKTTLQIQSLIQYHAYIITTGHHNTNIFISSKLISLYASLHNPKSSKQVFDSFNGFKDIFLWNSIIKAYFSNAMYPNCLEYYDSMRVSTALLPNQFTFPMVVSACAEVGGLVRGMTVHGLVLKLGMFECGSSAAIGSSFVYMYSKCGRVETARQVFDEMSVRDVVAWTALVIGYVQNGESENGLRCVFEMYRSTCFREEGDGRPNFRTLEGGFQACGNLEAVDSGRCLHGMVTKSGLVCYVAVRSSIVSMYSKCGTPDEAYTSFREAPVKDIKLWTSIIGACGKTGCVTRIVSGFMEMIVAGIDPDPMVVSCVISGLSNSVCVSAGKTFHGFIFRRQYYDNNNGDEMVRNALVSMYCKFGLIRYAENVFFNGGVSNSIVEKEVWNAMVCGYGKTKCGVKCIDLFREMVRLGFDPDSYGLVSVISSCSQLGEMMHLGRSVHGYAVKRLMMNEHTTSVSNSLIDMYGNFGELAVARKLFCMTNKDDIVTWNTMISVYTRSGDYAEAVSLFDKMVLQGGIKPTTTTLVTVLSACAHMASIEKGEEVHRNYIDDEMLSSNLTVATALVDMYAKCGHLEKSKNVFDKMTERDVVSWNVMISGYGMHGDARSAIDAFERMERSNAKPNELTFLALLSACSHAGLVEEGKSLFGRMGDDYSLKPTLKHYACMVNLLGRSGHLVEAENLVLSMPMVPDGGLWGALLSACKTHNDPEMGIRIARRAIECDPENDGYYVTISNLYDAIGMWEEADRARTLMKERGVEKAVGWSAV